MTDFAKKIQRLNKRMGWDCTHVDCICSDIRMKFATAAYAEAANEVLSQRFETQVTKSRNGEGVTVWLLAFDREHTLNPAGIVPPGSLQRKPHNARHVR